MLKIRLRRIGAKKKPSYRIVVADSRMPRDGRFLETIGHYDSRTDPPKVDVNEARVMYWLGHGAQPTEAVARILDKSGISERRGGAKVAKPLEEVVAERVPAKKAEAPAKKAEVPAKKAEVPAKRAEAPAKKAPPKKAPAKKAPVVPIENLGLSARVQNILSSAGIENVSQLLKKLEDIEAISGLGKKSQEEIREALEKGGFI
jgi:small subunit ribosomal protein S16